MNNAALMGMRMVAGLMNGALEGIDGPVVIGKKPDGAPVYGYRAWKSGCNVGVASTLAGAQELLAVSK